VAQAAGSAVARFAFVPRRSDAPPAPLEYDRTRDDSTGGDMGPARDMLRTAARRPAVTTGTVTTGAYGQRICRRWGQWTAQAA